MIYYLAPLSRSVHQMLTISEAHLLALLALRFVSEKLMRTHFEEARIS